METYNTENFVNNTSRIYRIFVVDDHPIIADGILRLCERKESLDVCGSAGDYESAIEGINRYLPDIVITDISLNGEKNGIDLIKNLKSHYPALPVMVLSMHDELHYAERAVRSGARGYVMKSRLTDEIINAVEHIISGNIFLSDLMASKLLDNLLENRPEEYHDISALTEREKEVFKLIGSGFSTADIAASLNINSKTVETYRLRIKNKFNLKNSSDLLKIAIEWNNHNQSVKS